jgi:2-polyprenyl-3-methyl-5-hydroxy-6-metoxy-1,4-benzoquinol methylase
MHRPEKGWDPVPQGYSLQYANHEWAAGAQEKLLDDLEARIGGFAGKTVLDLGGGPGHYSVAFAKRGAEVTWFDVSKNYRDFAQQKALESDVRLEFALGYLDEASRMLNRQFHLVFNRICWYYCFDDSSFATVIYELVRPGGWVFVDTNHSKVGRESASASLRARTWLNDAFGIKVGHPFPPRGRIERLFRRLPHSQLIAEYPPRNDRILFQRAESAT